MSQFKYSKGELENQSKIARSIFDNAKVPFSAPTTPNIQKPLLKRKIKMVVTSRSNGYQYRPGQTNNKEFNKGIIALAVILLLGIFIFTSISSNLENNQINNFKESNVVIGNNYNLHSEAYNLQAKVIATPNGTSPKKEIVAVKTNIVDSQNKKISSRISLTSKDGKEYLVNKDKTLLTKGNYDVKVVFDNLSIQTIAISNLQIENSTDFLRVDDVPENVTSEFDAVEVYAIDPTGINFSEAIVTVTATGKSLYKCVEWDFDQQNCYGEWKLFKTGLIPGQDYTFILTPDDPAFLETNQTHFDLGNYNNTYYNTTLSAVMLNATYTNGSFTSNILNAAFNSEWLNISWWRRYGSALPNSGSSDTYIINSVNMTGNVLLMHMDEVANDSGPSGVDVQDFSGNNNHGNVTGTISYNVTGRINKMLSFNGINSSIIVDNSTSLDLNKFTLEAIINLSNSSQIGPIFDKGANYRLAIKNGNLTFNSYNASSVSYVKNTVATGLGGAKHIHPVDFDNDGDMDLVVSDGGTDFSWYENDGTNLVFTKRTIATALNRARNIYPSDVDKDGDVDVVVAEDDTNLNWYENDGTNLVFTKHVIVNNGGAAFIGVFPTDFDNDGDVDVVGTDDGNGDFSWYENDGTNLVFTKRTIVTVANKANQIYPSDYDHDGDVDVVVAEDDTNINWYENDGTNLVFTKHVIINDGAARYLFIFPTDFDNDGDVDVVASDRNNDQFSWYENDGTNLVYTKHIISTALNRAENIYPTDYDQDGDNDVVVVEDKVNLNWYENDGTNLVFTKHVIINDATAKYKDVFPIDFDNDGDVDVVGADDNNGDFSWYESSNPSASVGISPNGWMYVVTTYNGTDALVYVNGSLVLTAPQNISSSSKDLLIGSSHTSFDDSALHSALKSSTRSYFNGSLDEISIWNRTLSASEILNHYKRSVLSMNLFARTCDDASCINDNWTDVSDVAPLTLSITNNTYFQYRFDLLTNDPMYSPELHNVTIEYDVLPVEETGLNVTTGDGTPLNITLIITNSTGNAVVNSTGTSFNVSLPVGLYNITQIPVNQSEFEQILIVGVNITSSLNLIGVDYPAINYANGFAPIAFDPTKLNFSYADVTKNATGISLYKCTEWNYTLGTCGQTYCSLNDEDNGLCEMNATWELINNSLTVGQMYNFRLNATDPGYSEYTESSGENSTLSTTFVNKTVLSFTPTIAGEHVIIASAQLHGNSKKESVLARVLVDGLIVSNVTWEPYDAAIANDYQSYAMHVIQNLTTVPHLIELQWASEKGTATFIKNARITVFDTAEYVNSTNDATTALTTVLTDITNISLNPSVTDDYLILGSGEIENVNCNKGNAVTVALNKNGANLGNYTYRCKDVTDNRPFFFHDVVNLSTGVQNNLSIKANQEVASGSIRRTRLSAIRLTDDFEVHTAVNNTLGNVSCLGACTSAYANQTTLSFTPFESADYLIIGTAEFNPNNKNNFAFVNLKVDGVNACNIISTYRDNPTLENRLNFVCQQNVTLNKSVHTMNIEFAAQGTDPATTIRNARITALRLTPDGTAPIINISSPVNNSAFSSTSVPLNYSVQDLTLDSCFYSLNGASNVTLANCNNVTLTANVGSNNLILYANDSIGNTSSKFSTFIVDLNAPSVTIESPTSLQIFKQASIPLNVTAIDNNSGVSDVYYNLNFGTNVLSNTKLQINVTAVDPTLIPVARIDSNHSNKNLLNPAQSFTPAEIMNVSQIELSLQKVGVGLNNSIVQIQTDNLGSPSGTVLAQGTINNNLVNGSYQLIPITLNQTMGLDAGAKYWIVMNASGSATNYFRWQPNDEGIYSQGESNANATVDMLFKVLDAYRYRSFVPSNQGFNSITIYVNDSANNINQSSLISYFVDSVPPYFYGYNESSDPLQLGDTETFTVNITDTTSSLISRLIEINGSNQSLINVVGDQYQFNFTPSNLGVINYTYFATDNVGNINQSDIFNITVVDTQSPVISNIQNNPNTLLELNPGVVVNVTANISDPILDTIILQYKESNLSTFTNTTMSLVSGTQYLGSFTTTNANNYSYRIFANDTAGNNNFSVITNISVFIEDTWTITPTNFGTIVSNISEIITLTNLTIENTGNKNLSFELSTFNPIRSFVTFNETVFNLTSGQNKTIEVNATAPTIDADYLINILVNETSGNSTITDLNTTGVLRVSQVDISSSKTQFTSAPSSATIGDTVSIKAIVENNGTLSLTNLNLDLTLPSGWTNLTSLSTSTANLIVGNTLILNVNATVGGTTGAINLFANSSADTGVNSSDTSAVVVNTVVTVTTTSSGGGGGGGGGSSSGGLRELVGSLSVNDKVNVIRGDTSYYTIPLENNFASSKISNVKAKVVGDFPGTISFVPSTIDEIAFDEIGFMKAKILVPSFVETGSYPIEIIIEGNLAYGVLNYPYKKTVSLIINIDRISNTTANIKINKAEDAIIAMERLSISNNKINKMLENAKSALAKGDLNKVDLLVDKIIDTSSAAITSEKIINDLSKSISDLENKGYDMSQSKELLALAEFAFEREDYLLAEKRARDAQLLYSIESQPQLDLFNLFIDWWWLVLILLAGFGIGFYLTYSSWLFWYINRRLNLLYLEEIALKELMNSTQHKYFEEKDMEEYDYHKTMEGYSKRLTQIRHRRVKLVLERHKLFKLSKNKDYLNQEKDQILNMYKKDQESYFHNKSISKREYRRRSEMYKLKLTDIDEEINLDKIKKGDKNEKL